MKRIVALTCVLGLAACGEDEQGPSEVATDAGRSDASVRVDGSVLPRGDASVPLGIDGGRDSGLDGGAAVDSGSQVPLPSVPDSSSPSTPGLDASAPETRADAAAPAPAPADAGTSVVVVADTGVNRPGDAGAGTVVVDASLPVDAGAPVTVTVPAAADSFVYVGSWDWSAPHYNPVRVFALDHETGTFTRLGGDYDFGSNPSFISRNQKGDRLYITNEFGDGKGGVHVVSLDPKTGVPTLLEREPYKYGDKPNGLVYSKLTPSPSEKFLLASSYDDGTITVYPVENDGKLGAHVDQEIVARPEGVQSPQTHSVLVHPSMDFAYAPNKFLDTIGQYKFDKTTGALELIGYYDVINDKTITAEEQAAGEAKTSEVEGPRHLSFSHDGKYAFVTFEKSQRLRTYVIGEGGNLSKRSEEYLFEGAEKVTQDQRAAHVLAHPTKNFVYATNRDTHTSISVFSYDDDGLLRREQDLFTQGTVPRHFDIEQEGKVLVLANQGSDKAATGSLLMYDIDQEKGTLTQKGALVTGLTEPTAVILVDVKK